MTPRHDAELELRAGLAAAMRHDYDAAIAAFLRALASDPKLRDAKLNLLDAYIGAGRFADADAMVEDALRDYSTDSAFIETIAMLRELEGRYDDALELIRSKYVNLAARSKAYPKYLRILVGACHWEEAVLAAREALAQPSLWAPYARLARVLSLLHFNEAELARQELAQLDIEQYGSLIESWARAFAQSGALGPIQELFARTSLAADPAVAALRARFTA